MAGCSTDALQLQQNFCHCSFCVFLEQCMFWRLWNEAGLYELLLDVNFTVYKTEYFFFCFPVFFCSLTAFCLDFFADSCVRKVEQTSRCLLLEFDHLNQSNSVQYNVRGWTKTVRMASRTMHLQALWHTSSKYVVFTVL